MTLWIGNGASLKSSSQWQLKEFSGHELFIFKIDVMIFRWFAAQWKLFYAVGDQFDKKYSVFTCYLSRFLYFIMCYQLQMLKEYHGFLQKYGF